MKFRCQKEKLLRGLQLISNVVNDRQTIPILSNVLIETVNENTVSLTSSDLKMGLEYQLEADVIESGSVTAPAKRLLAIVRELPELDVYLSADERHNVEVVCGKSDFKIIGLSKEEFPALAHLDEAPIRFLQKDVREMLKKTSIAVSHDTTRYVLNGVFVQLKAGRLIMVATDGRRLSYAEKEIDLAEEDERSVIIPLKMVQELLKVLGDDGFVDIILGEREIEFLVPPVRYICQIIDGKYPNYEQVIPEDSAYGIQLNREEFLSVMRRSAVLTDQKLNRVKFELKHNVMQISTKTPELGESVEEVDIQHDGEELSIGFNPSFILDALKTMEEEDVVLELTDSKRAGVLTSGSSFKYVIMPMRLV